jgi:ribosomal protein S18 acetylase RimI-like enzyme
MKIRPLEPEDAPAFQDLRLFALQESPSAFGSSYEDERDRNTQQIAAFIAGSDERTFFGWFADEKLCGVCGVGREQGMKERHIAFIRSMYVAPPARNNGIGRQLLLAAMARASSWPGVEQVTLAVTASNDSAVNLYKSCGFVEVGRMPRALKLESEYFDEITMLHRLGAA